MEEIKKTNAGGNKVPWYFKKSSLVVAFLCVGPLMLPLVWINPYYSLRKKIIITVITGVLTYFIWAATAKAMQSLGESFKILKAL